MATIPIHNPQLPFLGQIPGGLRAQVMLRFRGMVHSGGRMQINIQCGPATEPRDDVALHLSIRPQENALIRNHYQNRIWGAEERFGHSPIYYGQPFDILVLAEHNQYKIAVNGTHFSTFTHRIPMQRVQFVSVSGEGVMHVIGLENDNSGPGGPTMMPQTFPIQNMPTVCPMPSAPSSLSYPPSALSYPPMSHQAPVMPPHGGVPVFPGMPSAPPPYTSSPYPIGGMSSNVTSYPSTDPMVFKKEFY